MPGRQVDPNDLVIFCREKLASYKRPREIAIVDDVRRSPVGKPDYEWARAVLTR